MRHFSLPFADNISVCSDSWQQLHLAHLRRFLLEIRREVKIENHRSILENHGTVDRPLTIRQTIIGSGRYRPDEDIKLATISNIAKPTAKNDVRKMIGLSQLFPI
jgi:hypothetical protein